jgi:Mesyanzhinovviridae DNA primase
MTASSAASDAAQPDKYSTDPDAWLAYLNANYAVIQNMGGKCRVIREQVCPVLGRSRLSRITFNDFKNAFLNREVQTGETFQKGKRKGLPKLQKLGLWWLGHPEGRIYETLGFFPGREKPAYNSSRFSFSLR